VEVWVFSGSLASFMAQLFLAILGAFFLSSWEGFHHHFLYLFLLFD
jgi:hypothetical protein